MLLKSLWNEQSARMPPGGAIGRSVNGARAAERKPRAGAPGWREYVTEESSTTGLPGGYDLLVEVAQDQQLPIF